MMNIEHNSTYISWFREIKEKISRAQIRATLAANCELILFYWDLGESIAKKLKENAWAIRSLNNFQRIFHLNSRGFRAFHVQTFIISKNFMTAFLLSQIQMQLSPRRGDN